MLDSDMESLFDISLKINGGVIREPGVDLFLQKHSDGSGVDIENPAGLAVVDLVGHAFVLGAVDNDVDVVALG